MRELPKFGFVSSPEFDSIKIISFEPPYYIANVCEISQNNPERISEYIDDMIQGRYPIAKIKGYSIFFRIFTSLEPDNDAELQQKVLNEMAQFYLTERVLQKVGKYNKFDESGRTIREAADARDKAIKLRERRRKAND